ncbi:MAG: Ribonuclease toxin, BrnT, of type toxin-antitoxin system, partial [Pseudomonadota bacterium]
RLIFVVFTLRQYGAETRIRPISARHMHRKEIEHYEKEISHPDQ